MPIEISTNTGTRQTTYVIYQFGALFFVFTHTHTHSERFNVVSLCRFFFLSFSLFSIVAVRHIVGGCMVACLSLSLFCRAFWWENQIELEWMAGRWMQCQIKPKLNQKLNYIFRVCAFYRFVRLVSHSHILSHCARAYFMVWSEVH